MTSTEAGYTVVVAEKPSVARDIARVLGASKRGEGYLYGGGYAVTWAIGHLVTLAQPHEIRAAWKPWRREHLPMVPETWPLVVVSRTEDQFQVVARLLQSEKTRRVVAATDAGREGELIFRYIYEMAGATCAFDRLWISSLTPEAIRAGFDALRAGQDFDPLADAARGRSQADWLVGMNLTRAYTLAFDARSRGRDQAERDGPFSVGRVQTPTLAMLVERELSIREFVPEAYHEVEATFEAPTGTWTGRWFREEPGADGASRRVTRLPASGEESALVRARALQGQAAIGSVKQDRKVAPPPLLYDLTELQRAGNRLYGFSATRTLELAQALYETHKVLSYPRTDSRHLSRDVARTLPRVVAAIASPYQRRLAKGTGDRPLGRRFVNDDRVTDHHAIIPTPTPLPAAVAKGSDLWKIYDLVCRRLLAAWHQDHVSAVTEVIAEITGPGAGEGEALVVDRYRATGTTVEQVGWRALEPAGRRKGKAGDDEVTGELPSGLRAGLPQRVLDAEAQARETRAPRAFTEATLLTAMESAGRSLDDQELSDAMRARGLGTPATRAGTIETLLKRGYIVRKKKILRATDKGVELVRTVHDDVKSPQMTGEWEYRLKQIEQGQESLERFITDIADWVRGVVSQVGTRAWQEALPAAPIPPADAKARAQLEREARARATGRERPPTAPDRLRALSQRVFKRRDLGPPEEQACAALIEGRDVLWVGPADDRRARCGQLAALARAGGALVLSPHVAMIEARITALREQGVAAERVHAGRSRDQANQACRAWLDGTPDLLFVTPERLSVPGFADLLARRAPALVVVDEAQRLSPLAYDHRAGGEALVALLGRLREPAGGGRGGPPVLAQAMAASDGLRLDLISRLGLREPASLVVDPAPARVALEIVELDVDQRPAAIRRALRAASRRPALVLASTRAGVEELARLLREGLGAEVGVVACHAGVPGPERELGLRDFHADRAQVLVATGAFAPAAARPELRTVILTGQPACVEAWAEAAALPGRDGRRARAILMHGWADRRSRRFLIARDAPDDEARRAAEAGLERLEALCRQAGCRAAALVGAFEGGAAREEPCGLCDVCAPDKAVALPLRPPDEAAVVMITRILKAVRAVAWMSVGGLHRRQFSKELERDAFEAVIEALVRARICELKDDVFEQDGRAIPFRRVALRPGDELSFDAEELRAALVERVRLPRGRLPTRK